MAKYIFQTPALILIATLICSCGKGSSDNIDYGIGISERTNDAIAELDAGVAGDH